MKGDLGVVIDLKKIKEDGYEVNVGEDYMYIIGIEVENIDDMLCILRNKLKLSEEEVNEVVGKLIEIMNVKFIKKYIGGNV